MTAAEVAARESVAAAALLAQENVHLAVAAATDLRALLDYHRAFRGMRAEVVEVANAAVAPLVALLEDVRAQNDFYERHGAAVAEQENAVRLTSAAVRALDALNRRAVDGVPAHAAWMARVQSQAWAWLRSCAAMWNSLMVSDRHFACRTQRNAEAVYAAAVLDGLPPREAANALYRQPKLIEGLTLLCAARHRLGQLAPRFDRQWGFSYWVDPPPLPPPPAPAPPAAAPAATKPRGLSRRGTLA